MKKEKEGKTDLLSKRKTKKKETDRKMNSVVDNLKRV